MKIKRRILLRIFFFMKCEIVNLKTQNGKGSYLKLSRNDLEMEKSCDM